MALAWDAACQRLINWRYFNESHTGKIFYVLTTPIKRLAKIAGRESATFIFKN
jgi:hypothetical protein